VFGTLGVTELALMVAVAALVIGVGRIRRPAPLPAPALAPVAGGSRYIDRLRTLVGR